MEHRIDMPVNLSIARSVMVAAMLISCVDVVAQTSSSGRNFTLQPGESRGLVSKDALGKPCLDLEAIGRAHVSNPLIYDHIVSVANRCLRPLKLKVCYFESDRCTELNVAGKNRKDIVLGVGAKTFRYTYRGMP